ncbi:hypothetical protein E1287_11280 [Actinomadura sp. KC06]|nr:hypothetical protein E1287_11280 [Actinomadura sp. KC06]
MRARGSTPLRRVRADAARRQMRARARRWMQARGPARAERAARETHGTVRRGRGYAGGRGRVAERVVSACGARGAGDARHGQTRARARRQMWARGRERVSGACGCAAWGRTAWAWVRRGARVRRVGGRLCGRGRVVRVCVRGVGKRGGGRVG